jgi:hypothetical protein
MANEASENDSRHGFGRGTAVRRYWLERCQGFQAVRADGRSLGRVKWLETNPNGTYIRLTGLRSRLVPISTVEIVWPALSTLLIAEQPLQPQEERDPRVANRAESIASVQHGSDDPRSRLRPPWADETLPWWELLDDTTSVERPVSSPRHQPPARRWRQIDWSALTTPTLPSLPPIRSAGMMLLARTNDDFKKLASVLERQRREANRAISGTRRGVSRDWAATRTAASRAIRDGRLALGRLLIRFALRIAGSRDPLKEITQELGEPLGDYAGSENR